MTASGGMASRRGFTILELVVIFIVIGLLTRIAIPKLRGAQSWYELDRASRQLVGDLQLAQSEAGRRNRTVTVRQVSGSTYRLTILVGSTEQTVHQRVMDGGSTFTGSWGPIAFRAFGSPTFPASAPLDITIANAGRSRTVRIAAGGAVGLRP